MYELTTIRTCTDMQGAVCFEWTSVAEAVAISSHQFAMFLGLISFFGIIFIMLYAYRRTN